jgi:UDP-3-O-[3-hydroxymyristoyl] glucosamine N-acyltransferase
VESVPLTKEGVSSVESVTQPGSSWKAQLGAVFGVVVLVVQLVPSAQVPVGVQLAAPGVKELAQPAGKAGAVTPSTFWLKTTMGVQVCVGVGVGVDEGVGVGVGVGVGGGVRVGVAVGVGLGAVVWKVTSNRGGLVAFSLVANFAALP